MKPSPDHQDRNRSSHKDFGGLTSEQHLLQTAAAVRSHDDQIAACALGEPANSFGGRMIDLMHQVHRARTHAG